MIRPRVSLEGLISNWKAGSTVRLRTLHTITYRSVGTGTVQLDSLSLSCASKWWKRFQLDAPKWPKKKRKRKTFKIDTPNWLVYSVCCSTAWAFQQFPDQPTCLNQHVSCLCLRSSRATVLTVCGDDCTLETQDIEITPEKECWWNVVVFPGLETKPLFYMPW